jgi:hypothetical protein
MLPSLETLVEEAAQVIAAVLPLGLRWRASPRWWLHALDFQG